MNSTCMKEDDRKEYRLYNPWQQLKNVTNLLVEPEVKTLVALGGKDRNEYWQIIIE